MFLKCWVIDTFEQTLIYTDSQLEFLNLYPDLLISGKKKWIDAKVS